MATTINTNPTPDEQAESSIAGGLLVILGIVATLLVIYFIYNHSMSPEVNRSDNTTYESTVVNTAPGNDSNRDNDRAVSNDNADTTTRDSDTGTMNSNANDNDADTTTTTTTTYEGE